MIYEEILNLVIKKPDWVEVLEKIVKKKNLDPDDINIKEIVCYYLDYIRNVNGLKIPGNLILAASILLRIKAYMISFKEREVKETEYEIKELKEPLLKIRKKKVTLKDLIETVKDIIKIEEKEKLKKATIKKQEFEELEDFGFFDTNFDYIEEIVEEKEDFDVFIGSVLDTIKKKKDLENIVLFSQILGNKDDVLYVCKVFLSVLHLANKGIVVLWQEEYFGEIIIKVVE
jgi:chromatin segregation and condensation protein Rec8/ScpA/Scc1 (kleisin family)